LSSASPNKNIPFLVRAVTEARRLGLPYSLVIVGHLPAGGLAARGEGGILTTGFLAPEELAAVLAGAEALVFPSLYEGFGLPVLEAMALGVPVLCSDRASLPEVGGDAVVYFNPEDLNDLVGRLRSHAADEAGRMALRRRGIAQAAQFSWAHTAAETVRIYRQVAGGASADALELLHRRPAST
jgi:alpha-1,3-rhamnosyl/mannosyltransferase